MTIDSGDFRRYLISEYNIADRDYILDSIHRKNSIRVLKKIKSSLLDEKSAIVVKPSSELYSYFLEEYGNKLEIDDNNIIVPTLEYKKRK